VTEQQLFGLFLIAAAAIFAGVGIHGMLSGKAFLIDSGAKNVWLKKQDAPLFFNIYVLVMLVLSVVFMLFGIGVFNHQPTNPACLDACSDGPVQSERKE
jgi:hypothetical protein